MKLKPFLLEEWLERYEHSAKYNLAASTGPAWTLSQMLELMTPDEKERLFETPLSYCPATGYESLRHEVASMYGARDEEIQIVTGASEALHALFFEAAGSGTGSRPQANVILSRPAYPPMVAIPDALGLELRYYELRHERGFRFDVEEIAGLIDAQTRLILINSPHNPTGAVASEEDIEAVAAVAQDRGVRLVVDEVYHPIYTGARARHRSAAEYTHATVLGDFSKAFSLSGLRIGWILERDKERRKALWNSHATFTISTNFPGELLAEVATRHRETIFARARDVAQKNLAVLDQLFDAHASTVEWVRPTGGMTGFPRLLVSEDARPTCEEAARRSVVLGPGDCFGFPAHFRIGFGAQADGYDKAIEILSDVLEHARRVA
jgi:aspartate/methionine/tyrosine aminotransferase